ncbi:hypothetical protein EWI07_09115 [Sporolactobacillus sp. THM7-4]|nr:hypothetical protein EWI07_09115 [Sporolactobacillus sp. THM7-4]
MKQLVIIAVKDATLKKFSKQVRDIFGDLLDISVCKLKDMNRQVFTPGSVALVFGQYYQSLVASFFSDGTRPNVLVAKKIVNAARLRPILALPRGEKLLVINDHEETTREATRQLNEIFFEYRFIPFTAKKPVPADIRYIVTPDAEDCVPITGKKVINIGDRVLSIETIIDIYRTFNLKTEGSIEQFTTRYIKSLIKIDAMNDKHLKAKPGYARELSINHLISKIEQHGFLDESLAMLAIYLEGKKRNTAFGRLKMQRLLAERNVFCSEQQVRIRTKILSDLGLITVRKGRAGSTISRNGEDFLKHVSLLRKNCRDTP